MIDDGAAAGHVIVEVKLGGLGPGVAVCAQVKVAICEVACGTQVRPIAGELAPTVAGALIVRAPPEVTVNAAVPAGIVQASATEAVAIPAVATLTGTEPVPPVSVAFVSGLIVGAVGTGATNSVSAALLPGTLRTRAPAEDSRRLTEVPANAAEVVNESVPRAPAGLVGQAFPKSAQINSTYELVAASASPFSASASTPLSP